MFHIAALLMSPFLRDLYTYMCNLYILFHFKLTSKKITLHEEKYYCSKLHNNINPVTQKVNLNIVTGNKAT